MCAMRDVDPTLAPMRLAILPPPALAGVVRYFHIEHSSPGPVIVPATPCPMIGFYLAGGSRFAAPDGSERRCGEPMVSGALTRPTPAVWEPGTTFISAMLEAGQFARLLDIPLPELRDTLLPLDVLAPQLGAARLQERLQRMTGSMQWVAAVSDWLLQLLGKREGQRLPFALPAGALALPTEAIAGHCGLSVRTLERRYLASYGQTIRDSRRMARYVKALGRLMLLPPRHGLLTRLAMDCGYHDQAHMVRDFVHFTGMPPGALMDGAAADAAGKLRLLRYEGDSRRIVTRED